MEAKIEHREHVETAPTVTKGDIKARAEPSKTLLLSKEKYYDLFNEWMHKAPEIFYPIIHESLCGGDTPFQRHMTQEILQGKTLRKTKGRIGLLLTIDDKLKGIYSFLEKSKEDYAKEIVAKYKGNEEEFKETAYAFLHQIYPDAKLTLTDIKDSDTPVPKTARKVVELPQVFAFIKESIIIAHDKCDKFVAEFERDCKDTPKEKEATVTPAEKYVSFWNEYFLCCLKINTHLSPFNDAVNAAINELLPTMKQNAPKFSIWRTLVGVFHTFCFHPLRKYLGTYCATLFKELCLLTIENSIKDPTPATAPMTKEQLLSYLQDATAVELPSEKPNLQKEIMEKISELTYIIQAVVDMEVNEVSIHFTRSRGFVPYPNCLQNPLNLAADEILKAQKGSAEHMHKALESFIELVKEVLPPYLWKDIEKIALDKSSEVIKGQLLALGFEFAKLSPEEKKAKGGDIKLDPKDAQLAGVIMQLKNETGKALFSGEGIKLFCAFIKNQHKDLASKIMQNKQTQDNLKNNKKTVEDLEIEIRNEYLGIKMTEEVAERFRLGGMLPSALKNLH